jgi:TonB family protein
VITRAPVPGNDSDEPIVKLAQPVGGLVAYDKYLEKNRKYPELALVNNVKGKVIIGFDVGTNGELGNFEVIRSLGFGCDEEVVRLVKEGPGWNPTSEDAVPVESTVRVKMKFDAAKFKARKK